MKNWIFLFVAILSETIATSALKMSEGFTVFLPSVLVVLGYSLSFYFLSLTLRSVPIGVAYAIWSGVGLALVTLIGWLAFNQKLDAAAIIGISLIMLGVVVMFGFSESISS
ncbi:MAG: multidrug efflux SMR transporter [Gammaproteobacteria bacterium]|nr:multidrug efflux SMR transporter [Gammaproteobacteria bacterium]